MMLRSSRVWAGVMQKIRSAYSRSFGVTGWEMCDVRLNPIALTTFRAMGFAEEKSFALVPADRK